MRSTQINHAEIGARVPGWGAETALLPPAWDPSTAAGTAALNAELTRQAAVIGYVNDFHLMLLLTLAVTPLVLLLRGARPVPGPAQVLADH